MPGSSASTPPADDSVDLLISVFGVIFAPDAEAAAAEMARVVAPGGRMVLSAWIPEGAISRGGASGQGSGRPSAGRIARLAALRLAGPRVAGDPVRALWVRSADGETGDRLHAASPEAFIAAEAREHPMRIAAAAVLGEEGTAAVARRTQEDYAAANEDPAAFKVTSRYAIAEIWREA